MVSVEPSTWSWDWRAVKLQAPGRFPPPLSPLFEFLNPCELPAEP